MRVFLYRFFERGGTRNDEIRNLLSWTAWARRPTDHTGVSSSDPAQWDDWLAALAIVRDGNDPEGIINEERGGHV